MAVQTVLPTNAGDGETSYATNSALQRRVSMKAWPVIEEAVRELVRDGSNSFPDCFKIADLGCASGPNCFSVTSNIIGIIRQSCRKSGKKPPEFHVLLNDLPGNDFNTLFKSLPTLYDNQKQGDEEEGSLCFVSGVPGSFYGRLFPCKSLHFVHSSYSLHWLAQTPKGLENNKTNIYIAKTSPEDVFRAYLQQFVSDFSKFLSLRAEEIISGGQMVLAFMGRSVADPFTKDCSAQVTLLGKSLADMVEEGLVKEADLYSFNVPFYAPYKDEVKLVIEKEGSFQLKRLEVFQVNWDGSESYDDPNSSGKLVAATIRAFAEPALVRHFGYSFPVDDFFAKYADRVAEHLSYERDCHFNIVVSLTKK